MPAPKTNRPTHGTGAARREAMRRKRERDERLRKLRLPAAIGVIVLIGVVLVLVSRGGGSSAGVPPAGAQSSFGTTAAAAGDATIDGIPCEVGERLTYHVHAHLAIYVDGKQETVPQGIGINQSKPCIYWLHTHTADGLIHVEAPTEQAFTLGQLFDVWAQPLSATQVASAPGAVTAYVDGQPYTGDVRGIALSSHSVVQLDVGAGNPGAQPFSFPSNT